MPHDLQDLPELVGGAAPQLPKAGNLFMDILYITIGLGLLVLGAHLLVGGASNVAARMGVSRMVIGATIVALGTSLPELLTVLVATAKGHDAIGLGNIVGSNIINVLGVLGLAVLILPLQIDQTDRTNVTTLVAFVLASLYLLWCLLYRKEITRFDGAVLFAGFIIFSVLNYRTRTPL
jgi:cation:H+ antiporter